MATNLFNKEHKATSDKYREGYDRIDWGKAGEAEKKEDKEASADD